MAKLLDGKKVAESWKRSLAQKTYGKVGSLVAILVGDNPASILYLKKKAKMAEDLGIKFEVFKFKSNASEAVIIKKIQTLNENKKVGGIIIQLPLPSRFDTARIVNTMYASKDVDGMTDENIASGSVLPATAVGILKLLDEYKIKIKDQDIVLLGFTRLLNVPLSMYWARQGNRVTVLQKDTKDMQSLKVADVIISATGVPGIIKGSLIKKDVIVVDAGISQVDGRVAGDVDLMTVSKRAKYISPVPGGVGPITVVSLFANLIRISKKTL